jgi:hypothetical protein
MPSVRAEGAALNTSTATGDFAVWAVFSFLPPQALKQQHIASSAHRLYRFIPLLLVD